MSTSTTSSFPSADLDLSRRIETAEGQTCVGFVRARARLAPESGASVLQRAGAWALFDGAGSPVSQTFGLGLFEPATDADLEVIEDFFASRGAEVFHEVSPHADASTFELLNGRGYEGFEFTNVLYCPIEAVRVVSSASEVRVRMAEANEAELWSTTASRGWLPPQPAGADVDEATMQLTAFLREIGRVTATNERAVPFFAEIDGRSIATATLAMHEGVAMLAGASTAPEARNRGAQLALLDARLRHAAEHGCTLATMGALPGSTSQRNAERQGFRIAYTRTKWRKQSQRMKS